MRLLAPSFFGLVFLGVPVAIAGEVVLRVQGMVCPNCTAAITAGVQATPGVDRVRADLDNGEIAVTTRAEPEPVAYRRVIEELGFRVLDHEARLPETDAVLRTLRDQLKADFPSGVFTARVTRTRRADGRALLWFRLTLPPAAVESWLGLLDEGETPLAVVLEAAPDWARSTEAGSSVFDAARLCRDAAAVAVLAPNRASLLLCLHPEE